MNDKPLILWIIAKSNAKNLATHCECMAGQGETCSYMTSLLWTITIAVEESSLTVVQKCVYWVKPPVTKTVSYQPIVEINIGGKSVGVVLVAPKRVTVMQQQISKSHLFHQQIQQGHLMCYLDVKVQSLQCCLLWSHTVRLTLQQQ